MYINEEELQFGTPPSSASDSVSSSDFGGAGRSTSPPENQQKQLTIFYGGRVCVCDVTELQARAILMIASREMEEKMRSPSSGSPSSASPPVSPIIESQLYSPVPPTGLSMKRSLQRHPNPTFFNMRLLPWVILEGIFCTTISTAAAVSLA
ncbi:hypothetical protein JRO89_XS06G0015400 [Xanthoceras sorbifolium]|uniref:Protein TIFY n=1 Tax=Xanthoceras sorbifolium TaxID=99658 RepID=A0ABQ8HW30_9ROSI|nr:hypothetical protein JRO89_XS06G0015400 [Xanthoceras sorbifolium]